MTISATQQARRRRRPRAAALLVWWCIAASLLACIALTWVIAVPVAGQSLCIRDAFPTTAGGAAYPNTQLALADIPSGAGTAARPLTKDHWSEAVTLPRPDFKSAIPTFDSSACPHLQSGLLDWHNPATWPGNVVPAQGGTDVTLPANAKVLLSSCSVSANAIFGTITVPATSELIFGDAAISIRAKGFKVFGALRAGAPTCRLRNKVSITLHGARSDQVTNPAPSPWVKGIYVANGTLSLHGTLFTPTWTRLAATAKAGDTVLLVQDVPNWQPGQKIVITTTDLKDARDFHKNEELTISAVYTTSLGSTVGAIRVTTPLAYTHYGGPEYQAEVALLSRNILVQGNEATSEPTDTSPIACTDSYGSSYPCENKFTNGFGGHIMVTGTLASAYVAGVELYRMGQTNVLGRYPLHFHLMGSQQGRSIGAVATDNAVHRSFFRCMTVHGTHYAKLYENTAYDAIGHCYFLEDGVEEKNELHYNFGAHVHSIGPAYTPFFDSFDSQYSPWVDEDATKLILPSDVSAGVFYAGNAHNSWFGNAASGGWTGFSFPTVARPVKVFASVTDMSPQTRPFILFKGNSAHSTGFWFGSAGGVYVGGQLSYKGTWGSSLLTYTPGRSKSHSTCSVAADDWCSEENQLWLKFEDVKVFLSNRGMQHWGDRSDLIRIEFSDINLAANVFGDVSGRNILHTCRTSNKPTWFAGCANAGSPSPDIGWGVCHQRDWAFFSGFLGWQWYDVGQRHIITDSTFRNCRADWNGPCVYNEEYNSCSGNSIWQMLTHSDQYVPEVMQATRNIKYENVNVPRLVKFTTALTDPLGNTIAGRLANWFDADGSVYADYIPALKGKPVQLGSTWANQWWRLNEACVTVAGAGVGLPEDQLYACPRQAGDSSASVQVTYNTTLQSRIGNDICVNGAWDAGSVRPCPAAGTVTHFGRTESSGLAVDANAKITGPIIAASGGWFFRFAGGGTPSTFYIQGLVVPSDASLVMAFPYPPGTTFDISANLNWCETWWGGVCTHAFRAVNSVDAVRNGYGDTYFFDGQVLYVRVLLRQKGGSFGSATEWTEINAVGMFERNGLALVEGDYADVGSAPPSSNTNYWITIRAVNCPVGGRCAAQPNTPVPPAVNPNVPPVPVPTTAAPVKTTARPVPTTPAIIKTTTRPAPSPVVVPKRTTSRKKTTTRRKRTTSRRRRTTTRRGRRFVVTTVRRVRKAAPTGGVGVLDVGALQEEEV